MRARKWLLGTVSFVGNMAHLLPRGAVVGALVAWVFAYKITAGSRPGLVRHTMLESESGLWVGGCMVAGIVAWALVGSVSRITLRYAVDGAWPFASCGALLGLFAREPTDFRHLLETGLVAEAVSFGGVVGGITAIALAPVLWLAQRWPRSPETRFTTHLMWFGFGCLMLGLGAGLSLVAVAGVSEGLVGHQWYQWDNLAWRLRAVLVGTVWWGLGGLVAGGIAGASAAEKQKSSQQREKEATPGGEAESTAEREKAQPVAHPCRQLERWECGVCRRSVTGITVENSFAVPSLTWADVERASGKTKEQIGGSPGQEVMRKCAACGAPLCHNCIQSRMKRHWWYSGYDRLACPLCAGIYGRGKVLVRFEGLADHQEDAARDT